MPRKPLLRTSEIPYHLIARSNNKEWFYLDIKEVWNIFCYYLSKAQNKYELQIHIFVLMNNHFHLLAQTPKANIDQVMYFLMKGIALEINKRTKRINHVFGGPYKWSLIKAKKDFFYVYKYISLNPVRAGITNKIQQYPYSSLYYSIRNLPLPFKISHTYLLDGQEEGKSAQEMRNFWNELILTIHENFSEEQNALIKKSLKKTEFSLAPKRSSRTKIFR